MAAVLNGSSEVIKATESAGGSTIRKRFRIHGDKYCAVCGDKALAHHFGALACESCKAFFRRNALRQSGLKSCTAQNCCKIDKDNRRSCPWCRLTKCFSVGMKPELIYDENQKKELMEKMKRSKLERQTVQEERSHLVSSTGRSITPPDSMTAAEAEGGCGNSCAQNINTLDAMSDSTAARSCQIMEGDGIFQSSDLLRLEQLKVVSEETSSAENNVQQSHKSGCKNGIEEVSITPNQCSAVCQQTGSLSNIQLLNASIQASGWAKQMEPLTTDLGTLTRNELPSDPQLYRRLSEEERMLLRQLSVAYENTILAYLLEPRSTVKLDSTNYSIEGSLSDYETVVQTATVFAKRLGDFQSLDFDDRIACFKMAVDMLVAVYNSYIFVAERNSWLMIKGEVSFDLLMTLFPTYTVMGWRMEQNRKLKSLAKNDVTIYSLLHCILLFNPRGEKISDRQLVSSLREKYVILLRHYLEATFSFLYAEEYFQELQSQIVQIQDLSRADRKFADETNCHLTDDFLPFKLLQELHSEDK
ncbi:uncharacterized protein LOC143300331 [Babylonia areolata]|uniref:uncharacterized protein LOC143300331 n=1 Tax=Babylonia areolata TaxID=304850 RepID=UPI003FD333C0